MRSRPAAFIFTVALLIAAWGMLEARQRGGAPGGGAGAAGRGGGPQPPVGSMPSRKFEKITDGVYYATSTGSMSVGSNSVVIVNDDDALLIDPGETPATASAFLEDIKTITNKPVRFVVDSHYHFDHAHGNQIFGPEVTLIGHDRTYDMLAGNPLQGQAYVTQAAPELLQQRLDAMKTQLPSATDPPQRSNLERQILATELRIVQEKAIKPTPPTTTFSQRMTLHRGRREIQILYLGRSHTDTDIVVYLPQERIVASGDMMESQISYAADAWVSEWPDTLDKLTALDFDTVLPGHGTPFKGKEKIRAFQVYLRDLYKQATAFRQQGLSVEDTAKRIDLTSHAGDWPQLRAPGADVRAVQRMYDLAANPNAPLRSANSAQYPAK
jgi:glyoxylase-like metal-dependent hydrolase (beta-lactamase superfamily II)